MAHPNPSEYATSDPGRAAFLLTRFHLIRTTLNDKGKVEFVFNNPDRQCEGGLQDLFMNSPIGALDFVKALDSLQALAEKAKAVIPNE